MYNVTLAILQWLYNTIACHSLFFAIVLLTLAVRIVLFPIFHKSSKDQLVMKKIAPELERIKRERKEDKEQQMRELMSVYKKHKLNPFSGILLLIVQFPVFIVLFKIFRDSALLEQLFNDGSMFLGASLTAPSVVISVLAAAAQYVSGSMMLGKSDGTDAMQKFNKMMVYLMPLMTLLILVKLPAALGVYWGVSTCFSIAQTLVIQRKMAYSDTSNGDTGATSATGAHASPHGV